MFTTLATRGSLLVWLLGALPSDAVDDAPHSRTAPAASETAPAGQEMPADDDRARQPRLPDVVIAASDDDDELYRTPLDYSAGRDVIPPQEVDESGAINTQELMRRTPGAHYFEETGTDSKPNIALRGVTSNSEGTSRSANVSLLADGIPLAPAPYGHAGQSLFPFTLERVHAVDMLRGGHTVRYGPNTVSGVINFLTRPIPDHSMLEQSLSFNTYGDMASYTGIGGTYGKLGIWAESVYKTGSTFRDHGDFTLQNYALKSSYQFSDDVRGLFQLEFFDDESDLSGGLSRSAYQDDPEQSQTQQDRFEGDQLRGNFKVEWDIDESSRLDVSGFAFGGDRTFYLGRPRQYGSDPVDIRATPRPMDVWALQPQYTRWYEMGDVDGELVTGIRYQVEDVTRKRTTTPAGGPTNVDYDNRYDYYAWSAFIENTWRGERWSVTPGVRFEDVTIDGEATMSDVSVTRDFTEVLPAISASYLVTDTCSVYANVQSSFLPPQANHIELSDDPQNLEAQYAWTYEIGTRTTWGDGLLSPDLCVYSIDYEDRIERDPDHDDVFLNVGNTTHQGVELVLDSDLGAASESLAGVNLYTTVSYNESEFANGEYDGNTVPHAPQWIGSWGASWHPEESGFWAAFDGYVIGRAYSDADNTRQINADGTRGLRPAYSVWNARVGYDHQIAKNIRFRVQVGGINLFDEEYFEVRAGKGLFPGPPQGAYTSMGLTIDL